MHGTNAIRRKHDWALIVGGVLVFIMGIMVMAWPGASLVSIAIMAGAVLIVAGVADFVSYGQVSGTPGAGWLIANGICDVVLGMLFVIYPVATAAMLPWLAGIFVICYSVFAIITAIGIRGTFSSWGWLLATGVVGLLCGIMFIAMPESFVVFLGIFLLMRGVTMTVEGIVLPASVAAQIEGI